MTRSRSIHPQPRRTAVMQTLSRRLRQAVLDAVLRHDGSSPPLRVTAAATPTAPARLAASQTGDPDQQAGLTATHELYLRGYRSAAARAGHGEFDDVGHAVAYFVAVNLQALHGIEPHADVLEPLERQLRVVTRVCSDWDRASVTQRQFFFEQIAITGVLVSTAWSRARAQGAQEIAAVRRAARRYLEQMLGLDPDAVTLGASGLVPRSTRQVAAAATALAA